MTRDQGEELADAIALVVRAVLDERPTDVAGLRLIRVVRRIEEDAFKRGVEHQHAYTLGRVAQALDIL